MKKHGYVVIGMSEEMLNNESEYLRDDVDLFLNGKGEVIPIIRLTRFEAIRMRWQMLCWYLKNHYRLKLRKI